MPKLNPTTFDRNFRKLLDEERELQEQLSAIQGRLAELNSKIEAYRLVSEECAVNLIETDIVTPDELRGKELRDALVMIAEHHSGELNVYQYRPILVEAGVLRGEPKSVSSRLHDTLAGFERFEQTGERGRWKLVDKSETRKGAITTDAPRGKLRPAGKTYMEIIADSPPPWISLFIADCVERFLPVLEKRRHVGLTELEFIKEAIRQLQLSRDAKMDTRVFMKNLAEILSMAAGTMNPLQIHERPAHEILAAMRIMAKDIAGSEKREEKWQADRFNDYWNYDGNLPKEMQL